MTDQRPVSVTPTAEWSRRTRRAVIVAGSVIVLAPVGVVVAMTMTDPTAPVSLPASTGADVEVPGGVGTVVDITKARLVADASGARVWEAPATSGTDSCSVTQIAAGLPVSVTCGLPTGGIEEEIFTFDGGRAAGGAYRAVVRVSSSVTSLTLDGTPLKVIDGLAVFSPGSDARTLRATAGSRVKTLDLRPFVTEAPPLTR